jgi:hypothetical protein
MSQKTRVLHVLEGGSSITQWDTFHWSKPIMRLGAIIFDLREEGYEISTETIESPGGARVGKYTLVRKPEDSMTTDRRRTISDGLY